MSVCLSVCPSVCVCVCLSVYKITQKKNALINLKLEHVVVYENSSAFCDQVQGHSVTLKIFPHLLQYKLSRPISQLWHMLGSCD